MRKIKRMKPGVFFFGAIVSIMPMIHLWDTTVSKQAEAEMYEYYLDHQLFDLQSNNLPEVSDAEFEQHSSSNLQIPETLELGNTPNHSTDYQSFITTQESVAILDQYDGLEESDYWLLCKIVMAEMGHQSYRAQQAVASEVLNRLESSYFPDTIQGVLMQSGQYYDGPPCFRDSKGNWREVTEADITESVRDAVHSALTDGIDYANGAFYHISPNYLTQDVVNSFYYNYGEPCLELDGGLFFTRNS